MTKLLLSMQVLVILAVLGIGYFLGRELSAVRRELAGGADRTPAPADPAAAGRIASLERKMDRLLATVPGRLSAAEEKVDDILTALQFLSVDVDWIKRTTWDTLQVLQAGSEAPEPPIPEKYRALMNPETREALVKAAAEKGVRLLADPDRVEVAGVIVQNRAPLECFAVVSGGREHEAVVAVTGSYPRDGKKLPDRLAATINACLLALGYERGTPVRYSRDGKVLPPEGEKIRIYVEWKDAEGNRVRVRAEDLVYDIQTKRAMQRDPWVYVGSRFERDPASGETIYLADATGDVAVTYSWPNTIIDNITKEAADDVYYTCYTPRIPAVGTKVTLVFSRDPLPAREFPEEDGTRRGK